MVPTIAVFGKELRARYFNGNSTTNIEPFPFPADSARGTIGSNESYI